MFCNLKVFKKSVIENQGIDNKGTTLREQTQLKTTVWAISFLKKMKQYTSTTSDKCD